MRRLLLPLLALALTAPLLAPASAQVAGPPGGPIGPQDLLITGEETWEEDRILTQRVLVANDSVLTIRGARVVLNETAFLVEATGRLVVESLPGDPAILTTQSTIGWNGSVRGRLELRGLPDDPVVVHPLGGTSGMAGPSIVFSGGLSVGAGEIDARHVVFRDYISGVAVGNGARGTFDGVSFSSPFGVGLLVTSANLTVSNATFAGMGGGIFAGLPSGPVQLSNLTFRNVGRAVVLRAAFDAEVSDLRVENSATCLDLVGPTSGTFRNVTCTDYLDRGIRGAPLDGGRAGPTATFVGLRVETSNASANEAVSITYPRGLVLEDVEIGPVPEVGLYVTGLDVSLDGVTFQDVGAWNLVLASPPSGAPREPPTEGAPGGAGWVLTTEEVVVNVRLPSGLPAQGARVTLRDDLDRASTRATGADGLMRRHAEIARIDANGTYEERTYSIEAVSADGTARATLDGYRPDGQPVILQLQETGSTTGGRATPGAPLALVAVGVALAALARRRG